MDNLNLVDNPWILVMDKEGREKEISIRTVLNQAQEYEDLSGESQSQNIAVFRFLLAFLYRVFLNNRNAQESIATWHRLWETGTFSCSELNDYLDSVQDRFWMIDELYPALQSPILKGRVKKGTCRCEVTRLNGNIAESDNKKRYFETRQGESIEYMDLSEAARWILQNNAFADTSAKNSVWFNQNIKSDPKNYSSQYYMESSKKEFQKKGVVVKGICGNFGLVYPMGKNLFKSLMYNLVPVDRDGRAWGRQVPIWEKDGETLEDENRVVPIPENPAEYLTFPSRRYLLECTEGKVTGAIWCRGYFTSVLNLLIEQNTFYRLKDKDSTDLIPDDRIREPFWKTFLGLIREKQTVPRPGVVDWIMRLEKESTKGKIKLEEPIYWRQIQMLYGNKGSAVERETNQFFLSYPKLFQREDADVVRVMIEEQNEKLEKAAFYFSKYLSSAGKVRPSLLTFIPDPKIYVYEAVERDFQVLIEELGDPKTDANLIMDEFEEKMKFQLKNLVKDVERWCDLEDFDARIIQFKETQRRGKKETVKKREYVSLPKEELIYKGKINKLYGGDGF